MRFLLSFLICLFFAFPSICEEAFPSTKPIPPNTSDILGDVEYAHFRRAMRAISSKNWSAARGYRAGIHQSAAAGLVDWYLALNDTNTDYFELADAVRSLKRWPRYGRIQALAERKIAASGMAPDAIIMRFDQWPASTGSGKIAHADALFATGHPEQARLMLLDAWRNHSLPKKTIKQVLKKHGSLISTKDHEARIDMLLWQHKAREAERSLSKTGRNFRLLSIARIRLMRHSRGVDKAIENVPDAYKKHPGLLYERALWRRKARRTEEALPLVLHFGDSVTSEAGKKRMWTERNLHARRAYKDKEYQTAYELAKAHGFTSGAKFAEGEWLAGWLALTRLFKPEIAQKHFETLAAAVNTPVSQARAHYWLGEALAAQGKAIGADQQYREAAALNFTYYGQLAQSKLGPGYIAMGQDPEPNAYDVAIFTSHPQVQALKLLGQVGNLPTYRRFSYHLDDILPGAVDHVMLARLSNDNGQQGVGLRAAKAALLRGEVLPQSQWPIFAITDQPNRPEPALVLALSRQESELYPRAISGAGAHGLMQLLPRTAKATARHLHKPYRRNWLIDDPLYNLELGSAHFQELLEQFDGSYILSAAAYNAGARRSKQWIKDYGDPRSPSVDPVQWVESIPFSETRNYVQRVLENVQVYRNRLTDKPALIRLNEDLQRGSRP
jgi:soluble lytic murein transglycosylase